MHTRRWVWPAVVGGLLAPLAFAQACSSGGDDDVVCPAPQPAFKVLLRASNGNLPADTSMEVKFGAGVETFELASSDTFLETVRCRLSEVDGGDWDAGTEDVPAVSCDLWTQGAASVKVLATGYPPLEEALTAETGECDEIMTVEEELVLRPADGGT